MLKNQARYLNAWNIQAQSLSLALEGGILADVAKQAQLVTAASKFLELSRELQRAADAHRDALRPLSGVLQDLNLQMKPLAETVGMKEFANAHRNVARSIKLLPEILERDVALRSAISRSAGFDVQAAALGAAISDAGENAFVEGLSSAMVAASQHDAEVQGLAVGKAIVEWWEKWSPSVSDVLGFDRTVGLLSLILTLVSLYCTAGSDADREMFQLQMSSQLERLQVSVEQLSQKLDHQRRLQLSVYPTIANAVVREKPAGKARPIGRLGAGRLVEVVEERGAWIKIRYIEPISGEERLGWILANRVFGREG